MHIFNIYTCTKRISMSALGFLRQDPELSIRKFMANSVEQL